MDRGGRRSSVTSPGTIDIVIAEREAHALCAIGEDLYLVTRDGDLFKKVEGDDPTDLPVITGIPPQQIAKDRPAWCSATNACSTWPPTCGSRRGASLPDPGADDTNIDRLARVTIGKEAILLHFGQPPYREKIEQAGAS